MPDHTSPPQGNCRDISRQSSKNKWRGKIWSSEGKFGRKIESKESTNEDIAHFLQASGTDTNGASQNKSTTPRVEVPATRKPLPETPVYRPTMIDVYRGPKPRQNKGLRVTFEKAEPEVIGEGGDEAELPSMEVTKLHQDHTRFVQAQVQEPVSTLGSRRSQEPVQRPTYLDNQTSFSPPPLQRRPTGFTDLPSGTEINDQDRKIDYEASSYSVSLEGTHKALPQPPLRQTTRIDECTIDDHAKPTYGDRSQRMPAVDDDAGSVSPLDVPTSEIFASNSVTPHASPQPPIYYQELPMSSHGNRQSSSMREYGFPAAAPEIQIPPDFPKPEHKIRRQACRQHSSDPDAKVFTLRNVVKGLGDDSLEDFDSRVRRFNDIFRLGVSTHGNLNQIPFVQWIRTAAWWFVKGRGGLESTVRFRSLGTERGQSGTEGAPSSTLNQAWLDLAKALWIIREITPTHPEIRRFGSASMGSMLAVVKNFGDQELAELIEAHLSVMANLRALTMSMRRNGMLPPHALEIQRLDSRLLLELPSVPLIFASLLVNKAPGVPTKGNSGNFQPFFPILVGDTSRFFSFGRMFADASLNYDEDAARTTHVPCVLSVLRERTDWGVKAAIASQDGQIDLVIQANQDGLTWRDVQWKIPSHAIHIRLSKGVDLNLSFSEKDFKTLWGIYEYTRKVQKDFSPRKDEELIFERELKIFYCTGSAEFPSDPVQNCRLRLFEKRNSTAGGPSPRDLHEGHRLMLVTPPEKKTLSVVDYLFGKEQPVLFSYVKGKDGHRLSLRTASNVTLSPVFYEAPDPELFRSLLCGTSISKEDIAYNYLQLHSLSINAVSVDQVSKIGINQAGMQAFHKLRIIKKRVPTYEGGTSTMIGSEYLRMMIESDIGTLTDRFCLSPGELRMSMSVENLNEISILRLPQQDMTWSMLDGKVSEEELDLLRRTLHIIATSRTARTYHFRSASALHDFQTIISGFEVLFDGPAMTFAISRRRMVAMHKRWEATSVRLQVLKNNKVVQLVAFFKDFSHGACLNFILRITDVYEVFSKSGMFYLCLADAKFALPKGEEDQDREFVCLDSPEYPSEHDDIMIGFDNEQDRDRFAEALPAPVNKMSKMASLRK